MRRAVWACSAAAVLSAGAAEAQDVELLGARYGTRPPSEYFQQLERTPDAFRFTRGRAGRIRVNPPAGAPGPAAEGGVGGGTGPLRALGPREGPVVGDFAIPVVLGLFADSPENGPFAPETIATEYFGSGPGTVRAYYDEVSGGRVRLEGQVEGWRRAGLTRAQVTRNNGALTDAPLGAGGIGNFIYQLLEALVLADPDFDWGQFDNDGPDGIPNSGDDDGYVDALAVMHPTRGAECNGDYGVIWSHKWSLRGALRGVTFATPTRRAGTNEFIRIDDYFVQPAVSCDGPHLNEIGIFTHEVGHAFGLPDLYDVRSSGSHQGVGSWDLMATGAWGCDDRSPASPCHMGAWSKAMLGWVDVVPLAPGTDHGSRVLSPVQGAGTVYRIDAQDGSGEYFLLENRAASGFDSLVHGGGGLLVWQVDPSRVASRWGTNTVNGSDQPGVRLREADGYADLLRPGGGRGDAGDPFPGARGVREFHAGSVPASISYRGTPTGLTLLRIARSGANVSFDVTTRFSTVTLVADGWGGSPGPFRVDAAGAHPSGTTFTAAPFATRSFEAAGGETLEPGMRRPFSRWLDGSSSRTRTLRVPVRDTTFTAVYGGLEVQLSVALDGGVEGIVPAAVQSFPVSEDLWFREGQGVSVEVVPRTGFHFMDWGGALAGASNPAFVTMDAPVFASATLASVYAIATTNFSAAAAMPTDLALEIVNGNAPVQWSLVDGTFPDGLSLRAGGRIVGAALETGTFLLTVRARDAIGLTSEAEVRLDVARPTIPLARAASHFLGAEASLTEAERRYLDRHGNGDGRYDLGDFRAWVMSGPR